MAIPCPGFRVIDVTIGVNATAADPLTALLTALARFAVEFARAIPECDPPCVRVVGDPTWRNPVLSLRQLAGGRWTCTLGARLRVRVGCVKPAVAAAMRKRRRKGRRA